MAALVDWSRFTGGDSAASQFAPLLEEAKDLERRLIAQRDISKKYSEQIVDLQLELEDANEASAKGSSAPPAKKTKKPAAGIPKGTPAASKELEELKKKVAESHACAAAQAKELESLRAATKKAEKRERSLMHDVAKKDDEIRALTKKAEEALASLKKEQVSAQDAAKERRAREKRDMKRVQDLEERLRSANAAAAAAAAAVPAASLKAADSNVKGPDAIAAAQKPKTIQRPRTAASAPPAAAPAADSKETSDASPDATPVSLDVEDKKFEFSHPRLFHLRQFHSLMREHDNELKRFNAAQTSRGGVTLSEQPFVSGPTYPFSDDTTEYDTTRCPAWCDRVLMTLAGTQLLGDDAKYAMLREKHSLGDHNPVFLSFSLPATESAPARGVLLITANLGSAFEKPNLIEPLMTALLRLIEAKAPDFVALHLQEVGGKKKELKNLEQLMEPLFAVTRSKFWTSGLVCNGDVKNEFTALGAVYFVRHEAVKATQCYDFAASSFEPLGETHDNAELVAPSPQQAQKFPNVGKSRKGFLATRWRIDSRELNLVDVHMVHDESNVEASKTAPSEYAENRAVALGWLLRECGVSATRPWFLFGDFNFRLDLATFAPVLLTGEEQWRPMLVERRRRGMPSSPRKTTAPSEKNGPASNPAARRSSLPAALGGAGVGPAEADRLRKRVQHLEGEVRRLRELAATAEAKSRAAAAAAAASSANAAAAVAPIRNGPLATLEMEAKRFAFSLARPLFHDKRVRSALRRFDNELKRFNAAQSAEQKPQLIEMPFRGRPTYPWSDDETEYDTTRCPAWCDRVLMTGGAASIANAAQAAEYRMRTAATSLGDHNPVYLYTAVGSGDDAPNALFVTANLGSAFERPDLIEPLMNALGSTLDAKAPDFVALHLQEVGGKKKELKNLGQFLEPLFAATRAKFWTSGLVCNGNTQSDFTALGAVYFVRHEAVEATQCFNYETKRFAELGATHDNAELVSPAPGCAARFPNTKSRKGYLRSRWTVRGCDFETVNVHLFHDESNLEAREQKPSSYAQKRAIALTWMLDELALTDESVAFLFGDFNFRLDLSDLAAVLEAEDIWRVLMRAPRAAANQGAVGGGPVSSPKDAATTAAAHALASRLRDGAARVLLPAKSAPNLGAAAKEAAARVAASKVGSDEEGQNAQQQRRRSLATLRPKSDPRTADLSELQRAGAPGKTGAPARANRNGPREEVVAQSTADGAVQREIPRGPKV